MTDLSEQQERFCRLIVEGFNQRDAYREAGYKTTTDGATDANASRLLSNAKIAARIAELRANHAAKHDITIAYLVERAVRILDAAETDRAHGAAVAALKELGILSGKRIETRHNLNQDANEPSDLSRAELVAIARAGRPGTASPGDGAGRPDRVHPVH